MIVTQQPHSPYTWDKESVFRKLMFHKNRDFTAVSLILNPVQNLIIRKKLILFLF